MKNLVSLFSYLLISLALFSCGNNEPSDYQLKGKLTNSSGEFVSLVDVNSSETKTIDSVKVNENGEFIFTKKVPEKGFYSLQISSSNYATIIADSTEKISLEGDAKNLNEGYTVSGSNDSETLLRFNDFTKNKCRH